MRKSGKMVRNGKAIGMIDWRNAGHVKKVPHSVPGMTANPPSVFE
jgi:hypothetical protein